MARADLFRLAALGLLLAIFGTGLAFLFLRATGPSDSLEIVFPTPTPRGDAVVYVTGAVEREGLYALTEGERVADAVALAGGLTAEADRARVNLAARVADGDHVHVPRVGEEVTAPAGQAVETVLNINTATQQQLEELPGIGPRRAGAIVAFREANGGFQRVEDLLLVDGIGPTTLERIRPHISVR
ncbi:MAG: helix-hairpin-helix domain-containing protein [Dehalococcoidia bacterium]